MLRVLFLIEDVSFKTDSRVQRQTSALLSTGAASIVVICPAFEGEAEHDLLENGIHVYRYKKPALGEGFLAHVAEYATSLVQQTRLAARVWKKHGFDVIHVANPPDILWAVALPYKLLARVRFIYDQHDIVPELFSVRFGESHALVTPLVLAMERISYALADHVIVTTESFRKLATSRGGQRDADVSIVRNGPFLSRDFPATAPVPEVSALGRLVVGYVGHMNPQDHLEVFLEMARILRFDMGRTDIGFVMLGAGDSWAGLKQSRDAMGLTDAVAMPGRVPWAQILGSLTACDICVQPDPPTAFNRLLAHNKLMEYMALGKASVAFDMEETRVSGGEAVDYVPGERGARGLAEAVAALADDPVRRAALGKAARARIVGTLSWEQQAHTLLEVYQRLFADALAPVTAR